MILKELKYQMNKGVGDEWLIVGHHTNNDENNGLKLNNINLIVGRNSSGKSRTIDVIRKISDLFEGALKTSDLIYDTAIYELLFLDGAKEIHYFLEFKDGKIIQEKLTIAGNEKLNREKKTLYYEELGKNLSFETDEYTLTTVRRDSTQQPFLEDLYNWGKRLTHYKFGSSLGKHTFLRDINRINPDKLDLKNGDEVTVALIKGNKLDSNFEKNILLDMKYIEYPLSNTDVRTLKKLPVGYGISVQEEDLDGRTDQMEMSQGMFRALSLLIQVNYSLISKLPSCILIDDIGEGLDYGRSKKLVELIIEKVKGSSVQVIMTTNDQFVMNKIPLEYWSVIKREKGKSIFYNYTNSKEIFDEFEFTGLNNFSFFSSNYFMG